MKMTITVKYFILLLLGYKHVVRYYSGQAFGNEYSAPFVYVMKMLKVNTGLK